MFGWIAFTIFILSTLLFWVRRIRVAQNQDDKTSRTLVYIGWLLSIFAVGVFLFHRVVVHSGYDLSFYNALLIVTFFVNVIALLSSMLSKSEFLAMMVLPLGALGVLLNLTFYVPSPRIPYLLSFGIEIHILLSMMAFSILGLSAVQAVLLLIQERQLKTHHSSPLLSTLPSLHDTELSLHHFNVTGFILLTVALLSGFVYLDNIFAQHLVHKTVLSLVAWIVFGVLIWGRYQFGWRGITAVRWTLAGFFVLLLAFLGSKLVLELILQRS